MALVVNLPTGYYQATFRFSGAAVPNGAAIVFGGAIPPTGTPTPTSVGALLKTAWFTSGSIYGTGSSFVNSVQCSDILVKFGPLVDGASGLTTVAQTLGSGTPPGANPNSAMLVSKITALGGHVGRGRIYLPGLVATTIGQDGNLTTAIVNAVQAAANTTLTAMSTAQIPMYLLHVYSTGPVPAATTPRAPTLVTSLVVSPKAATQRDRLRR
jgi:hypothetical protein